MVVAVLKGHNLLEVSVALGQLGQEQQGLESVEWCGQVWERKGKEEKWEVVKWSNEYIIKSVVVKYTKEKEISNQKTCFPPLKILKYK